MSEKYENPRATYNIPLKSSENDIFHIGCTHLYHFLQINVKTDDCKTMMLKMHLELDDSPSTGEAAERNIQHNNCNNGLRQSVQQLEEEIKALKDAFLQAKDDLVNQLILNRIDKAPDVDNNATQQESNSNKQANNGNTHNDTENVASASEEYHKNTVPEEKPKVIDLRYNCVYIQNFQCYGSSLEKAFCNIRKLANEMNVEIPDDSVIHIEVQRNYKGNLDYYVYFCDASIKKEFLKNRHFLNYHPETSPLRIFDYSGWGIVDIANVQSSDLSLETAYVNVNGMAKKMGLANWNLRSSIDHIDVFSTKPNFLTYSVRFNNEFIRQEFLRRKENLKQFPETKSLEISDEGGHRLIFCDVNNVSMTVASANVIGVAELIGLSFTTNNFKRIYVLNCAPYFAGFSLNVEFSSKQLKEEFLQKKDKLKEMYCLDYPVQISDLNAKKNIVSIKYKYDDVTTAISFFGLAKQLGCSLTPVQIEHFLHLSQFIELTCTQL